jgi:hypothetical protein
VAKFRFPPKAWFRTREDRPLTDCLREYYERHPEHAPPAGWNYSDWCANEARLGDPAPLIGLLPHCNGLSAAAREVMVEALQDKQRKRGKKRLLDVEYAQIAMQVDRLTSELGTRKEAVAEVGRRRGISARTIKTALAAHPECCAPKRSRHAKASLVQNS